MNKPLVTQLFDKFMAARRDFEEHPNQKSATYAIKRQKEWLNHIKGN